MCVNVRAPLCAESGRAPLLYPMGSVKRQAGGHDRVASLRFSDEGSLLACQGAGKSMELFRWVWAACLLGMHACMGGGGGWGCVCMRVHASVLCSWCRLTLQNIFTPKSGW